MFRDTPSPGVSLSEEGCLIFRCVEHWKQQASTSTWQSESGKVNTMVKQLSVSEPLSKQRCREAGAKHFIGPPGTCLAYVSALDKVLMTLGQFTAYVQEAHANGPHMKVSWAISSMCQWGLAALITASPQKHPRLLAWRSVLTPALRWFNQPSVCSSSHPSICLSSIFPSVYQFHPFIQSSIHLSV